MTPDDLYLHHVDQPYGKEFAATVGRLQEGFLRDRVCDDFTGPQASLWGIESDAEDYLVEVAQELVEELAA